MKRAIKSMDMINSNDEIYATIRQHIMQALDLADEVYNPQLSKYLSLCLGIAFESSDK